MKIRVSKNEIVTAVSNVYRVVPTRSSNEVLEGIYLSAENGKLILKGYDLEIGIEAVINADVKEEGSVIVQARMFYDIVKKAPENNITISSSDKYIVTITCGKSRHRLTGISAEKYPSLPSDEEKTDTINIKAGVLENLIKHTIYAVSTNNSRPIYTGSLFELKDNTLSVIAVDGYQLAIRKQTDKEITSNNEFVISGKTLKELLVLITDPDSDVEIVVCKRHCVIKLDNCKIYTRMIEGNFLDYRSTIPSTKKTTVTVNSEDLQNAIERLMIVMIQKVNTPIKCEFLNRELHMTIKTSLGEAEEVVELNSYDGEDVTIGFNGNFLINGIKNADCEVVKLVLSSNLSPMIVTDEKSDSFINIVVPMKLS